MFAAHGSGFKLPSLFQLHSPFGTETLRHETSSTLELTVEHRFIPAFAMSATLFRAEFRELIDFDFVTSKYFNVNRSKSEGAELRATHTLAPGISLEASSTYLETRDEATGLPLLRRPRHASTAALKYHEEQWELSLTARHRGARPDVDPNTFTRVEAPAYELADLAFSYAFSPAGKSNTWKANARVENIFDRNHEEVAGYGTSSRAFFAGIGAEL